jgi:adenine-specific DNA-methyltransferase
MGYFQCKKQPCRKTIHLCQFLIELVERLIPALTNENDLVFDFFLGVSSTSATMVKNNRRGMGCEILKEYYDIASERTKLAMDGKLKTRPMDKPIYDLKSPKELSNNKMTIFVW